MTGLFRGGSEYVGITPSAKAPGHRRTKVAIGQTYGDLEIVAQSTSINGTRWRVRCVCGAELVVHSGELMRKAKPRQQCSVKCAGRKA